MRQHLPTTTGLRVLAALAQHGTISEAAKFLHMTQSAVSKQLKSVEDLVGLGLFSRTSQGLMPTEAGTVYIEQARVALGALETAAARVMHLRSNKPTLRLHVLPILGDRWFIQRFVQFAEAHPDIDVQFSSFAPSDTEDEADVVFRFGEGEWPGWHMDYFLGRDVVLVGSPHCIARHGGISDPMDIGSFPMLEHLKTPLYWNDFAIANNISEFRPERILKLGYYSLVIRAAIGGHGLALIPRSLILDELESGQLVNPLNLRYDSRNCYWLTTHADRDRNPQLEVFRNWALREAEKTENSVLERVSI
ncbi:LysR substrate-binding domain-containing protein [Brucella anthropi]|uniref:LysR substrate-binding domain-containing protein n=1 Tax=Brucella TaxID=234 RepID=UPI00124E971E|nr:MULTISPECIES: LysR substrate-binding domain-containing protein [Brucella/Ochrobactrum group]QOD66449.1 LysR family transcriptional regulator [Ochrobactrum sp. MT180101]KAB2756858.1 LysR family transcriptional regulator [Brucella anthropi]KAB2786747.1 LysR family transcriptional regulator [Brucella anthropi]MBM6397271.1 LysR family transcriptional regulator [Brucella anthropi]NIH75405.1 DNA-binding transcriptional LysR family regulator [Ochrobactrum sp. P20RRXII]